MLFRSPSHTQAYAIPSIQYSQQTLVSPAEEPSHQHQELSAPQPTIAAAYVNPTVENTAVLPAPDTSSIPAATLQYSLPQLQYAAHLQPVEYAQQYIAPPPQQLHHTHQYYPSQHFTSPIDIYHSLQKHQPSSLLDSYIPSSVILAAQRQRNAGFNRQILHAVPGGFPFQHPSQFYHQGSHQPGYNTIAYSTAQGYSKRSPKLVTERPLKLNKRN